MKYRTTIEIVCEAADKDEAINTAGEYLRGAVDNGVDMTSKTLPLVTHRVISYVMPLFVFGVILGAIFLKGGANEPSKETTCGIAVPVVFTVQPELKTQSDTEFRSDWSEKKDQAIMDYLKK